MMLMGRCSVWMSEGAVMAGTGVTKKALPRLRLRPTASRALTPAAECLLPHSRLRHQHISFLRRCLGTGAHDQALCSVSLTCR